MSFLSGARSEFHRELLAHVLRVNDRGVASNADSSSSASIALAGGIIERIGPSESGARLAGQIAGATFERLCASFVETTFRALTSLRPGQWTTGLASGRFPLPDYDQYRHLGDLARLARDNPELATALGNDYLIKPDIIVSRQPEPDDVINAEASLVDMKVARQTSIRAANNDLPILHASISCKWTLRSDRAQNARSEGLTLVRNRKGRLPHIAVVTGEPMPSRLASIALGTGDIDCVYHIALPELVETAEDLGREDASDMLRVMIEGQRLRDIADLPLDLTI